MCAAVTDGHMNSHTALLEKRLLVHVDAADTFVHILHFQHLALALHNVVQLHCLLNAAIIWCQTGAEKYRQKILRYQRDQCVLKKAFAHFLSLTFCPQEVA